MLPKMTRLDDSLRFWRALPSKRRSQLPLKGHITLRNPYEVNKVPLCSHEGWESFVAVPALTINDRRKTP